MPTISRLNKRNAAAQRARNQWLVRVGVAAGLTVLCLLGIVNQRLQSTINNKNHRNVVTPAQLLLRQRALLAEGTVGQVEPAAATSLEDTDRFLKKASAATTEQTTTTSSGKEKKSGKKKKDSTQKTKATTTTETEKETTKTKKADPVAEEEEEEEEETQDGSVLDEFVDEEEELVDEDEGESDGGDEIDEPEPSGEPPAEQETKTTKKKDSKTKATTTTEATTTTTEATTTTTEATTTTTEATTTTTEATTTTTEATTTTTESTTITEEKSSETGSSPDSSLSGSGDGSNSNDADSGSQDSSAAGGEDLSSGKTSATEKKSKKKKKKTAGKPQTPQEIFEEQAEEEEEEFRDAAGDSGSVEMEEEDLADTPSRKFVIRLFNLIPDAHGQDKGTVTIVTHPDWAPIGAKHFHDLVEDGFYTGCRFFRVLPDFIAQFGISGHPEIQAEAKQVVLQDDPVEHTNARGTLTYATSGPNTRTTQLFFNLKKEGNEFLDSQGFAPFAEVIDGLEVLDRINSEYGERPDQSKINNRGQEYLDRYPNLTYIRHIFEEKIEGTEDAE